MGYVIGSLVCVVLLCFLAIGFNHHRWLVKERQWLAHQQEYIKVLDQSRYFSTLPALTFSMGMGLDGKPCTDSAGRARWTAFEAEANAKIRGLHSALQNIARYFGEPDPCRCMKCQPAKIPNDVKKAAFLEGLKEMPMLPPSVGRNP